MTNEQRTISPIEQLVEHMEEIDSSIDEIANTGNGTEDEKMFCMLMQAKSTALLALVQAEANAMRSRPLVYSFGPDVKVERI